MELLTQAMEGWTDSDIETFEKLMTRFADGVTNIVDERGGDGKAWADKGWAAAAAAARTRTPRRTWRTPMSTTEPADAWRRVACARRTNLPVPPQILVILGGLMAGMFLAALDQSIVGTALPQIVSEFNSLDKLSWVVTAYLLTSTASTPLWGKISDLYGRRPLFIAAIVTFLAGSVLSALSQNIEMLIGFRAVQGLGAGGLMSLAFATIGDVIPPRERGKYMGYFGAVFGLSSVAGPLLGGLLTDGPGWRWIFWINLPIGLVALGIVAAVLKLPHVKRSHKIDYLGAAIVTGAVTSLLLAVSWSGPEQRLGQRHHARPAGRCRRAGRRLRPGRAAGLRADHPDGPVQGPDLLRLRRVRVPARLRDVRRADLPAALPAGGQGHVADPVRAGPAADDRRHLQRLDPERSADEQDRALQDLPDHLRGAGRRRDGDAVDDRPAPRRTGSWRSTCS